MITLKADRYFRRYEDVTPTLLKKENVKLLICDLDNTLRVRREKEPSEELKTWVKNILENGVRIVVVSNNIYKKKTKHFCKILGVPCLAFAKKPYHMGLIKNIEKYGEKSTTVMLGDKITTDVLAARFAGVRAWRVQVRKKIL